MKLFHVGDWADEGDPASDKKMPIIPMSSFVAGFMLVSLWDAALVVVVSGKCILNF